MIDLSTLREEVIHWRRRIAMMEAIIHGVAIVVGSCLAAGGWMVCIQDRLSLISMRKDRLANLSCYPRRIRIFIFAFMKSYNIPEFITGEVKRQGLYVGRESEDKGIDAGSRVKKSVA